VVKVISLGFFFNENIFTKLVFYQNVMYLSKIPRMLTSRSFLRNHVMYVVNWCTFLGRRIFPLCPIFSGSNQRCHTHSHKSTTAYYSRAQTHLRILETNWFQTTLW